MRIIIDFGHRSGKSQLARLAAKLDALQEGVAVMRESFDNLVTAVRAETTVVDSFIRYTTELAAKLEAALADDVPAEAVQAVIDEVKQTTDRVSAALVTNTVAADEGEGTTPAGNTFPTDDGSVPSTEGTADGPTPNPINADPNSSVPPEPTPNPIDPTPAPSDLPTFNGPSSTDNPA